MTWLAGWNYRKSKTINGSTAGIQTDYQLKLIVHKGPGTDTATDIYLGTNVRDDFGDIRFTEPDGTTLLNYWIESFVSGSVANIWIKIPSIPISPGTAIIYIYYNNPIAITTSNGTGTFVGFGDFNTDEGYTWINNGVAIPYGTCGQVCSSNQRAELVRAYADSIEDVYKSIPSVYNFVYEGKVTWNAANSNPGGFEVMTVSDSTTAPYVNSSTKSLGIQFDPYPTHLHAYIFARNGAGGLIWSTAEPSIDSGSWTYWVVLTRLDTLVTMKFYTDQTKTNLRGQTTLTLITGYDNSFTYIHPIYYDAYDPGKYVSGYIDNVSLRKYASPEPTFGVSGNEESSICSTTTKNIGNILTLQATPIQGVSPYTVEFRRANSQGIVNIIDTVNINSETYIIPIERLGGFSNPVYNVVEGSMTTRLYTINITDINDATSKVPGEGGSLLFATKMLDSCSPSQSCIKYCKVFVACSVPVCDFTVT